MRPLLHGMAALRSAEAAISAILGDSAAAERKEKIIPRPCPQCQLPAEITTRLWPMREGPCKSAVLELGNGRYHYARFQPRGVGRSH